MEEREIKILMKIEMEMVWEKRESRMDERERKKLGEREMGMEVGERDEYGKGREREITTRNL